MSNARNPFNDVDADIILRSSDAVEFQVHSAILRLASQHFRRILPMTACFPRKETRVITVPEDSKTIDGLLRFIYPMEEPVLDDLGFVGAVLKAGHNYQIDTIVNKLRRTLSVFSNPLRVYTIACECRLEEEARQAAQEFCETAGDRDGLASYVQEMDRISAGCYFRLLQYYNAYKTRDGLADGLRFCASDSSATASVAQAVDDLEIPYPYNKQLSATDVIIKSRDGFKLYANPSILTLSSKKLADRLSRSAADSIDSGARTIQLDENGNTLLILLQVNDPSAPAFPGLGDWNSIVEVMESADRLGMAKAVEYAKKCWVEHIKLRPLQSYFVAVRNGWEKEARIAAKYALLLPVDEYVPEMDWKGVTALSYRRFLLYRHECRTLVADLCRDNLGPKCGPEYNVYWSSYNLQDVPEYKHHCSWALCGSAPTITPIPLWQDPFDKHAYGLGGPWPIIMGHIFACPKARNGHWGRLLEVIWDCDSRGANAVQALDNIYLNFPREIAYNFAPGSAIGVLDNGDMQDMPIDMANR